MKLIQPTPEDVKYIRDVSHEAERFTIFNFEVDQSTVHVCFVSSNFRVPSPLVFGGQPQGLIFGVLFRGWFWFNQKVDPKYVNEKLRLDSIGDAEPIAKFINIWFGEDDITNFNQELQDL